MKNILKKSITVVLVTNIILAACTVEAPQSISWNEPNIPSEMSNVESSELVDEQEANALPIPGPRPIPLQPSITSISEICDDDSEHDCYGDSQSGWVGVYSADNELMYVKYYVFGKFISISEVDGKYYLSCSGIGGDQKEVNEGFITNLQRAIQAIRNEEKHYREVSRNAASGVNWAIIGGLVVCAVGIGFTIWTSGVGWPAIIKGCGAGAVAGGIGGGVTAAGSGATEKRNALEDYKTAENNLRKLVREQCP